MPSHSIPRLSAIRAALAVVAGTTVVSLIQDAHAEPEPPGPVITHTDMDLLERFITLPVRPEAVSFETWDIGTPGGLGPTDRRFLALLRYDEAGFARVLKLLDAAGQEPQGRRVEAPSWLDATPSLEPLRREGDQLVLEGETARRATPFAQGSFPNGIAVALEDGRHVLVVMFTS